MDHIFRIAADHPIASLLCVGILFCIVFLGPVAG